MLLYVDEKPKKILSALMSYASAVWSLITGNQFFAKIMLVCTVRVCTAYSLALHVLVPEANKFGLPGLGACLYVLSSRWGDAICSQFSSVPGRTVETRQLIQSPHPHPFLIRPFLMPNRRPVQLPLARSPLGHET